MFSSKMVFKNKDHHEDHVEGGLQHLKTKIMVSCPITLWQMDGETMKKVTDFIFLGSKITAAMKLKDACSLEGKL